MEYTGNASILVDGEGREVKWQFVDNLNKQQQAEGLHLETGCEKHISNGESKR